jgi:dihydroorotase/N-acyl-D-amino-acid deacylase
MRKWLGYVAAILLAAPALPAIAAPEAPYDLVIRNAHIIDGTGSPWYAGDVAIRDGRIAAIGMVGDAPARRTIDAGGKVVAPGFIDMLGQSETSILVDPRLPSKIYQGITTEITGEGGSVAPLSDALVEADKLGYEHFHLTADWRTLGEYFARLEKQGMGINLASYVGATQVRRMVPSASRPRGTPAGSFYIRA